MQKEHLAPDSTTADFLVIGAMKCGTSTVCAYLEDHPDIFMVANCEPRFFSHDENWSSGLDSYAQYYSEAADYRLRGEGSNDYSNLETYPESPSRIFSYNPNIKLIYIARNPLERIRSDWIQRRVNQGNNIPASIHEAIKKYPEIFIGQSLYWKTILRYKEYFSDSQIHVCFMEDLKSDPESFFRSLVNFLEVPYHEIKRKKLNPSSGKKVPSATYSLISQSRVASLLKPLVSDKFKRKIRNSLFTVPESKIEKAEDIMTPQALRDVVQDAEKFLDAMGKPQDFWTLPKVSS